MTEADWQWRQQDNLAPHIGAEAWVLDIFGKPAFAAIRSDLEDVEDGDATWNIYAIMTAEDEGFSGFEPIDGAESLADAQAFLDRNREETLAQMRAADVD